MKNINTTKIKGKQGPQNMNRTSDSDSGESYNDQIPVFLARANRLRACATRASK
jgi:hypothetical protein